MTKVLITGGTGLVGRHLSKQLLERGYEVAILSRTQNFNNEIKSYTWDLDNNTIDEEALNNVDYIIHLAGANIGSKRWTSKRRQQILDSRIMPAKLLLKYIQKKDIKPKAFITASAVGYYGAVTANRIYIESDPPAEDFLGQTCRKWEQVADRFTDIGLRVVKVRTGVVLAKHGGAYSKIIKPIKMGLGSAIGNGKQYFPWIDIDDLCGIYIKAIEDTQMHGPYNAVAPEHITNRAFNHKVARYLNKPYWFPAIPALAMKLIFGKMSVVILNGSRVSADKIIAAGYEFLYPKLESSLKQLNS